MESRSEQPDGAGRSSNRDFSISSLRVSLDTTSEFAPADLDIPPLTPFDADLQERFRIDKFIGRGGFGEVWQAYDNDTKQAVAIKAPRTDRCITRRKINQFLLEAQKARELEGTQVVRVLDVIHAEGSNEGEVICFIVMQMMKGSLGDRLRTGERPSPRQAVTWIAPLAKTLAVIHQHGFIHRDVKPDNILFDEAGRPHLSDFGLAASIEEQFAEQPSILGTIRYMSPEQARGQHVDRQADIYSIGVVLYQLLALNHVDDQHHALPFLAQNATEYLTTLSDPNQHPRTLPEGVPAPLAEIVEKRCLCDDKSQRYRSASELSRDLERWMKEGKVSRRRLVVGGITLLGAATAVALWWFRPRKIAPNMLFFPENNKSSAIPVGDGKTLRVVAHNGTSLLSLGQHGHSQIKEVEIALHDCDPGGQVGLFFGYQLHNNESVCSYQTIEPKKSHVRRVKYVCPLANPNSRNEQATRRSRHGSTELDLVIKMTLRYDKLVELKVNDKAIDNVIITDPANTAFGTAEGRFGLYNQSSSASFSNLRIDGATISFEHPEGR